MAGLPLKWKGKRGNTENPRHHHGECALPCWFPAHVPCHPCPGPCWEVSLNPYARRQGGAEKVTLKVSPLPMTRQSGWINTQLLQALSFWTVFSTASKRPCGWCPSCPQWLPTQSHTCLWLLSPPFQLCFPTPIRTLWNLLQLIFREASPVRRLFWTSVFQIYYWPHISDMPTSPKMAPDFPIVSWFLC